MRNRWLAFVILSVLALSSLGAAAQQSKGTIRGYVFLDSNQNGVFDRCDEDNGVDDCVAETGLEGVFVTIAYGDYQHTYYTGNGDATPEPGPGLPDPSPGPGSYGPTPLPSGYWMVTVHVPDGYHSTTPSEVSALVPFDDGAVTEVNFGLYGSGAITYASGTGVAMGGGAGAGMLPDTGGLNVPAPVQVIALFGALVGLLALIGTPWAVAKARRVHTRWW
jgi:hypothetical protein